MHLCRCGDPEVITLFYLSDDIKVRILVVNRRWANAYAYCIHAYYNVKIPIQTMPRPFKWHISPRCINTMEQLTKLKQCVISILLKLSMYMRNERTSGVCDFTVTCTPLALLNSTLWCVLVNNCTCLAVFALYRDGFIAMSIFINNDSSFYYV